MNTILERVASLIWGNGIMILLLGAGVICTFRTKAVQLSLPAFLFKQARFRKRGNKAQFRIVCTSLGTAMGTGNITGVSAALVAGGPGAVFWMWISAFLGMALVYTENRLSYRYGTDDARGPIGYIKNGLGSRKLAAVFAVSCCGAACCMGGMVQVSSVTEAVRSTCDIPSWVFAFICFILIYTAVSGGCERIRSIAQCLLPAASLVYGILCIYCIIRHRSNISSSFTQIFHSAFGIRQTAGGILGHTISRSISVGLRRGIFSNEAGLGSSALLHSGADIENGTDQGMWAMLEVFIDTFICCTLTAVAVLCTAPDLSVITSLNITIGRIATPVIVLILTVFGFCTVIGWYYCGEIVFSYLTGGKHRWAAALFFSVTASLGALASISAIWSISDIFNGLMAFPNLAAILFIRPDNGSDDVK